MGWFSKSVKGSEDERNILIAAKDLLKNGTQPQPSIRGAISQAMKDLGYSASAAEAVIGTLRRYGEIPADTVEGVEEWGKGADADTLQKAFDNAIGGLKQ